MKLKQSLTVVYLLLNIYVFYVGTLQGLLNYQAWTLIGATEFPQLHQDVSQRTLSLFLPFFLLSLPLNFVMIWLRHPAISRGLVILVALLNLAIFIVTITLVIPIQDQLDQHKSVALIEQLVWYHFYLRTLPGLVVLVAIAAMLYQIIGKVTAPSV
ncbi:hypothetical protein [Spirosoma utsteinense]|uniref:DUF1772 domain-containing protein n=1 Tax=Spirosoma utsteinense TaxID=2585773 RepID=A0ABR6WDV7_9BACT|nr:hypothetical protein [Spirosoma utsteinense]MBC3789440.1 hypothetical protein [Spirosoma utsteinense]MBC3794717.1 hypothetical protein [Spirosoma utsteinense]